MRKPKLLTLVREPFSGLSHLSGAILSFMGLFALMHSAQLKGTLQHQVSFAIFGCSLILMYLASGLYHSLPLSEKGIKFLRRIDHMAIFILIAGSYTPFCLVALRESNGPSYFIIAWSIALVGIITKLFWIESPRWITVAMYLGMGWISVPLAFPLSHVVDPWCLYWIAIGGFFFTSGAIIYATKRPNPYPGVFGFHEIWHLFVMAGTFSHFWAIYRYL
ncbi:MAG: hemolysin [Bdellovibrionales bacterium GWA2_49_15]|nr:MAG: hemolysin [Bdellovibrionales bacterium GWA2_49_15]